MPFNRRFTGKVDEDYANHNTRMKFEREEENGKCLSILALYQFQSQVFQGNGGSEEARHLVKSLGMQNIRQVRAHIHTLVLVLVKGSEGKEARNHTVASGNMKKEKDELVVIIDHELGTNVIVRRIINHN